MLQERDDEVRREAGLPAEGQALEARHGLVRGAQAELKLHDVLRCREAQEVERELRRYGARVPDRDLRQQPVNKITLAADDAEAQTLLYLLELMYDARKDTVTLVAVIQWILQMLLFSMRSN